jgi:release factor glutamine methyltransferase
LNTTGKVCVIPWEISINRSDDKASGEASAVSVTRWTIQQLLDWTTGYFREHGSDQSRLDAEILLAEALDCRRIELYTRFQEEPPEAVRAVFREWVARHAEGEPVAYLVGHKEFFSLRFEVSPAVLIPRPETEHLVTEALDAIREYPPATALQVLDVGTGSGCVAVAICKHAGPVVMTASDVSAAALAVARDNVARHDLSDRIRLVQSDLLEGVDQPQRFHLIVSNPPYIGLDEKPGLDRSVVDFEPHEALFAAGPKGTETIRRLVQQAAPRLLPGGWLMFEISPLIADACRQLVEKTAELELLRVVKDLAGHPRILVARRRATEE